MPETITTYRKEDIWQLLKEVHDPEIPVLNIVEMGIVRDVEQNDEKIIVNITPTYSGCPAMYAIENEIRLKLADNGIEKARVKKDFSEPWTTDWMTDEAKQKLNDYGIAPPHPVDLENQEVECPYCGSTNTKVESEFGSTPCKAQHFCNDCQEPFEHFKCH
ncbi:MAG TPA: 1,2-phenylacetyl-CoA epoxidase subunit PaaD [Balneolaceae bacterium]|nr:1,2-phenylacetyl-CoA epoxidase subunit PaaD [Balneolaceae bacterium]